MTFNFAPWAIDGARTEAGLARLASYAGGGGRSGIVAPADLRVRALSTPGQGLRIDPGGAFVLNRYMTTPDESYVVSNPATHTVSSTTMPSSKPTLSYYLVCIVVGDPEFNQTGHPFMPAGALDPAVAPDYQYVRIVILPCDATDTTFEDLNKAYPGYALARLAIPANTTTVTTAMITDLRSLSQPKRDTELLIGRPTANQQRLDGVSSPASAWYEWVDFRPYITIPEWATKVQILTYMTGVANSGDAVAEVRTVLGATAGAAQVFDVDSNISSRSTVLTSFEQQVSAIAGTTVQLKIQGRQLFNLPGYAFVDEKTQIVFDVRFSEDII